MVLSGTEIKMSELSSAIPMKCCGDEPDFAQVFKAQYMGVAFEFKCKHCKHFAASPSLPSAVMAWNKNIDDRQRGRKH
jgi:hypothetical protein